MRPIREWFQKRREPVVNESVTVSRIAMCYRCGQIFINEGDVPNHLCVASSPQATYSWDIRTDSLSNAQYRDFTIIEEKEKE